MKYIYLLLLFSQVSYSQLDVYFPLSTVHFDDDYWINEDKDNQGGNKGLIASYSTDKTITSVGLISNSFLKTSLILCWGVKFKTWGLDSSVSLGLSTGYDDRDYILKRPKIMTNNQTIPFVVYTVKKSIYKNIGLQVNVSPLYLNYGVYINIK